MELLVENERMSVHVVSISDLSTFAAPTVGCAFPCLLWDHAGGSTRTERETVVQALLDADCRRLVCGGLDCDQWNYAMENAFIYRHLDEADQVSREVFVMSTDHLGENFDEVAFNFAHCMNFDDHEFRRFLVLHVGHAGARSELDLAVREWVLGVREA